MKKIVLFSIAFLAITITTIFFATNFTDKINVDASEILIDKITGDKYVLDKNRIYIEAFDKSGNAKWKTNPRIDGHLSDYREKNPTITSFHFYIDSTLEINEVIGIGNSNSQFGFIEKSNGKFEFLGQD